MNAESPNRSGDAEDDRPLNIVALAGGVGGAKLADGLAQVLRPNELTVVVNTGDDFEHLGLRISPDLDTVMYTLAGIANLETGWGQADETWGFLGALERLGGDTWFRIGDRDLATHVERTRRLRAGEPLSQVTQRLCEALGVRHRVLPMTDGHVRTMVRTAEGELEFQEYFVHRRCEPAVSGFRFDGAEMARPAPGVTESLARAELVVVCPSNPWVSIDPILAVPGMAEAVSGRPVVAVSPIVGGLAVKGPAAKMFCELGVQPSALAVAERCASWVSGLVIDSEDESAVEDVERLGVRCGVTGTVMRSREDRARLAGYVLAFGEGLIQYRAGAGV